MRPVGLWRIRLARVIGLSLAAAVMLPVEHAAADETTCAFPQRVRAISSGTQWVQEFSAFGRRSETTASRSLLIAVDGRSVSIKTESCTAKLSIASVLPAKKYNCGQGGKYKGKGLSYDASGAKGEGYLSILFCRNKVQVVDFWTANCRGIWYAEDQPGREQHTQGAGASLMRDESISMVSGYRNTRWETYRSTAPVISGTQRLSCTPEK